MPCIIDKLNSVQQQIDAAAAAAGRPASEITLLAVSKTRPANELRDAYAAGQRHFGENYLQESLEKIEALSELNDITWHFIGPIQSNKTRPIAEHFHWVHSVDRIKIARRLSEQRPDNLAPLNICLQINIDGEESKAGCLPDDAQALADEIATLPNITLRGLMAIPQATSDPEQQANAFRRMQQLLTDLQPSHPDLDTLSMGMSGDMEAAIAQGATIVRIGTAIFGPRDYSNTQK